MGSSKGQILLGGGLSRIIIDLPARRIHEAALPRTERDRTIVRRGFTWLLLIYYEPAGFAKDHTAAATATAVAAAAAAAAASAAASAAFAAVDVATARLSAVKSSPADRSGVSWNLPVTTV